MENDGNNSKGLNTGVKKSWSLALMSLIAITGFTFQIREVFVPFFQNGNTGQMGNPLSTEQLPGTDINIIRERHIQL